MSKIAIDVVLVPDESAQEICRKINQGIGGKIDFINTGKIPHISLMMGVIDESILQKIFQDIEKISHDFSEMKFTGNLRKYTIGNTGETGYSYELEENTEIKKLFSEIARKIRPKLSYENISIDMFYKSQKVESQSIIWVKGFENRTVEEYSSHITLGIGELENENMSAIQFETSKIALYQLGNYCTCENKLFEINL